MAEFMGAYIEHRLSVEESDRPRLLGDRPHWTALAYLKPGELYDTIRRELQQVMAGSDTRERLRLAAMVESYGDLLADYRPVLLDLAEQTANGQALHPAGAIGAALGVTFKPLEFEIATVRFEEEDAEEGDRVYSDEVEAVTVDERGQVIRWALMQVHYYREPLGDCPPLEMMAIPVGSFLMGSPDNEPERWDDEGPQHRVTVPSFWMGKYPVTQAQWRVVAEFPQVNQELDPDPSHFRGDNRPVEQVLWAEAVEFCDRLSQHTGRTYRLPTEAEWEYACRAGTETPFHVGPTITSELANYDASTPYGNGPKGEYRAETTLVDFFQHANAFGLHDMHGNVWEWCLDHWHSSYDGAPEDGSAWLTGDQDSLRVRRGGSWINNPRDCRSASRLNFNPRDRDNIIGFRVVCEVPGL